MCLAIPGQIIEVWTEGAAPFGRADFAGDVRRISLAFLPDLAVGDYVIVHAGFALTRVPPENVEKVMESVREAGLIDGLEPLEPTLVAPVASRERTEVPA